MNKNKRTKNWLRYRLIFIETLVFLLPSVTVMYLFFKKEVFLEISQMFIISSTLLLILAGLITMRHVFDKFHQIINAITDSKSLNHEKEYKKEDSEEDLHLITKDLKLLMENYESKTALLNEKSKELYIIKDIIKLLNKSDAISNIPDILLEKAMTLTDAEMGLILFSNTTGKRTHIIAQKGVEKPGYKDSILRNIESIIPEIVTGKEYSIVNNSLADTFDTQTGSTRSSIIYLPFFIQENMVGVTILGHAYNDKNFTDNNIKTLNILIDETVFAIEKYRLKKEFDKNIRELKSRAIEIEETNKNLQNEIKIRKFIEEEKDKLQSQLHVAQKLEALGTLAGGIAHNFNNLLMGIQGNATLINLGLEGENPIAKRAQNIEKLIHSGSKLTSQLLGYARKGQYEMSPINLNYLIGDICETFANTKKEIVIHEDLAEDLYMTMADANQIEQVLLNLFINAADAMPNSGDLFISTRNCDSNDFKNKPYTTRPDIYYILMSVRDTGEGMDRDTMEKVFEPFFSTKEPGKGTGLGLASCYGIIKGHGGYIDVDSEPGKGTTFSIYLPASDEKYPDDKETDKIIKKGSGKILVVDDEELILEVSATMVKELGYSVVDAKNGREAVEKFTQFKDEIDMVILDMVMPDLSGEEVFDKLKEINPEIKVLLASGYTFNNRTKALIERGCIGFIKKPYSLEELSNRLVSVNSVHQNLS